MKERHIFFIRLRNSRLRNAQKLRNEIFAFLKFCLYFIIMFSVSVSHSHYIYYGFSTCSHLVVLHNLFTEFYILQLITFFGLSIFHRHSINSLVKAIDDIASYLRFIFGFFGTLHLNHSLKRKIMSNNLTFKK